MLVRRRSASLAATCVVAALFACGRGPSSEAVPPSRGLAARPPNPSCVAPAPPKGRVLLEPAFGGVAFDRPVEMIERRSEGRVYVAEMPGRVKVIDTTTGDVTTALDIVGRVGSYFDQGLLGMALHPTAPYLYLTVERDRDATTREDLPYRSEIVRFRTDDGGKTFDPASETVLLRLDRPTADHYAGTLRYGPDGFLYIGVGDGGAFYAPASMRWDPNQLLASILRVDAWPYADGSSEPGAPPYRIPTDNPYASGGGRPEIYAGGFRNPWRFSFDRATGELWAGDVGEISYEEVNKVEKGKNYGWPTLEGEACFKPRVGCDPTGFAPPLFVYPHADGASITGGFVYRGKRLPELEGRYVFADFSVGRVFALRSDIDRGTRSEFLNGGGPKPNISSFGEDADGELYALDYTTGIIFALHPGDGDTLPVMPERLSQTGCVDPSDATRMGPGVIPYAVNVELWSDDANKSRFFAVPEGKTIHVRDDGDLEVPDGSVLMKTFTKGDRRIETRLLVKHEGGEWTGVSYAWNDEQTDAVLLDDAQEAVLPDGSPWSIPSPAQCFICHTASAKISLGFEAMQLNRDHRYGEGAPENQLTALSDVGLFDRRIDPHVTPRLPPIDGPAPLEDRARAYLHVNCAMCHREGNGTGARMDFRYGLPRAALEGCSPASYPGVTDGRVLVPGNPESSVLHRRVTTRDAYQMPPLGTRLVDPAGSALLEGWIRAMASCD